MIGKNLARRGFHRGMRVLLRLPGGRRLSRLARAVMPGLTEWLAPRYRAYDQPAAEPAAGGALRGMAGDDPTPGEDGGHDLSDDEARLYRLFAAQPGRRSATRMPAG